MNYTEVIRVDNRPVFFLRVSDHYGSKTSFLVAVWNLEMIKNISSNFGLLGVIVVRVVLYERLKLKINMNPGFASNIFK
jgi:hypothetical protein